MDTHGYNNNYAQNLIFINIHKLKTIKKPNFDQIIHMWITNTGEIGINRQDFKFSLTTKKALMKIRPYNQNALAFVPK